MPRVDLEADAAIEAIRAGEAREVTAVVRASDLDLTLNAIHLLRNPTWKEEHERALAEYKKLRGRRKEVKRSGEFGRRAWGFYRLIDGEPKFHPRPELGRPGAWTYFSYDRGFSIGGIVSPSYSRQLGLLADPTHNRDIRPQRVWEYQAEMEAGNWRDLLSDPITISRDGQIINGQHRLAAASRVDWSQVETDPLFLVVFGVDPIESLYADGSRRTAKDQQTIAHRAATANGRH